MTNIDVVVDAPAVLGECPLWSPLEQVLWWVDIEGRAVHRFDPVTGVDQSCPLDGRPGSIALTSRPGLLLVASEHQLLWFDWETQSARPWVALERPGVGIRMNDGRTDPAGRFWVGSMFEDTGAGRRVGSLHRVDPDGTTTVIRHPVGTANGLGFDAERSVMYFADTPTLEVLAWDYDAASASMTNERSFFDYEAVPGKPDGACVDADGCYWSASVRGWGVIRVTPDGRVDRRIELPVAKPTMPAFGGSDLSTLFITSIGVGSDEPTEAASGGVVAGSLLAIDLSPTGITGRPETPFAGQPPPD